MASPSAVTEDLTAEHVAHRLADAAADDYEGSARRRRGKHREEKTRADLGGAHATAVYRRFLLRSPLLTAVEQRFLGLVIERGKRLTNIYPSPSYIRERLPTEGPKRTRMRLYQIRASCVRKGFLRLWSLTFVRVTDTEEETVMGGTGYQVCLPPGVITPEAAGWDGPEDWSNWCAKWR